MRTCIIIIFTLLLNMVVNGQYVGVPKYVGVPGKTTLAIFPEYSPYQSNKNLNKNEKVIGIMNQIKDYYNSLDAYPTKINDGWHNVIAMNNYDFCAERKVYVENNKVTKFIVDDWIYKNISFSVNISKAKAIVRLLNDDESQGDWLELYFLEYINAPNSYTTPPIETGTVSFWTNYKKAGDIMVYLEDTYIGSFTSYFNQGVPQCGQDGTLTVTYKAGTYHLRAYTVGGWSSLNWEGTITITAGVCTLQGLTKK
ncbi:MAG TPA: hypothetical protein PKG96_07745 [Bacilli bacterium]|nr:hypothetical protein [Bacilli bacterium]